MQEKTFDDRSVPAADAPSGSPDVALHESSHKDHFLQLMFFQASHGSEELHGFQYPNRATESYAPLRHSKAKDGDLYTLPLSSTAARVRLDSPATEVMTDLRRVGTATIDGHTSIDEANQAMIAHRVRSLFVVDDIRKVLGIITSTDILGERPIQLAHARGIRYDEVLVRDIMTPTDRLEVLDFHDVQRARVGDVVATLRLAGRQHALAVEATEGATIRQQTVRGIFSLMQISRQLGIPPQQIHDIARTFAEIEAAIAS